MCFLFDTRFNIHFSDFNNDVQAVLTFTIQEETSQNKFRQKSSCSAYKRFIKTSKYRCET